MEFETIQDLTPQQKNSEDFKIGQQVVVKNTQSKYAVSVNFDCIPYPDAPPVSNRAEREAYVKRINDILHGILTITTIIDNYNIQVLAFVELPDDYFSSNHFKLYKP